MATKIIWRKFRLYKRFELDVWGFNALAPQCNTRLLQMIVQWKKDRRAYYLSKRMRYVYEIKKMKRPKARKKAKRKFLMRKMTKLFYLTLSYHQFRRLALKAAAMEGSFESNFIMFIECRVIGILYRMQWMFSVFQLRHFIFNKHVLINNKIITLCNAPLQLGDVIRLRVKSMGLKIRFDLIRRFSRGMLYFNVPRFLYVSYKLMFGLVFDEPRKIDLAYPQKFIDVYRGADIY